MKNVGENVGSESPSLDDLGERPAVGAARDHLKKRAALLRQFKAHQMRGDGATYREIGNHFGVSVVRARQLVFAYEYRMQRVRSNRDKIRTIKKRWDLARRGAPIITRGR